MIGLPAAWASKRLVDCGAILAGGTPSKAEPDFWGGDTPWISAKSLKTLDVFDSEDRLTEAGVNVATIAPAGSVLFVVRGMSLANEFRVGVAKRAVAFNQDVRALRPAPDVDSTYLARYLKAVEARVLSLTDEASHGTKRLTSDRLAEIPVPLPPLAEQRRIADILDRADAMRAKRREALRRLEALSEAVFVDLFGDPASNPRGWPTIAIGDTAELMSDGPFGSNLKSEHYTSSGVRVIRLQNIGVGQFLDSDRAFVSEEHFLRLRRQPCLPGDILIGTLGDPNIRACVQPPWILKALNKADCVQLRLDPTKAEAAYICGLLNHPSTEQLAHSLLLGQTRVRISMGRLRPHA